MTAKEFLEQTSPNDKYGLRAELQKHRLRGMVEKEMEMYHQAKLKELGIANVVGQREQLAAIFEKMNRQHITMLEIGDYNKLAKEILSS